MGKSTKKIKSERINVLRKQYDSFLEEDKRRKDRNEYILGQIEKMRTSSALVPVRHKENATRNDYIYAMPKVPEYQNKLQRAGDDKQIISNKSIMLKPYVNNLEEPSILNEIRKKYILIPRLQPVIQNNVTHFETLCDNPITDTDWKSKYNILNELKKNEKEIPAETLHDITLNDDSMSYDKPDESSSTINNNETNSSINTMQQNEIKRHDYDIQSDDMISISDLNKNIEENKIIDNDRKEYKEIADVGNIKKTVDIPYTNVTKQSEFDKKNCINNNLNDQKLDENESKINNNDDNNHTNEYDFSIDNVKNESNLNENHDQNSFNEDERIQINEPVIENTAVPDTHLKDNIIKEKSYEENDQQRETINDVKAYINVNEEFTNSNNICKTEEIKEQEKYNENEPIYNEAEQEYSQNHSNNEKIIEEKVFEPEQKEIYAKEENVYEYDDGNAAEYPTEHENYTNEQYAYYDESQQEQPYKEEMTGQQESTEHYDQNYEQGYANDYVDPNLTEYQDQQYIDNSYEQQQQGDFTNVNYDGVVDNINYDYVNSDNVEVTNQDQPENVTMYNYDNQDTQENIVYENQQYEDNQQYSTIPNEQVQYEEPQDYNNYIEPDTIANGAQQPEVHDYEENTPTIADTNVENVDMPEELAEKA